MVKSGWVGIERDRTHRRYTWGDEAQKGDMICPKVRISRSSFLPFLGVAQYLDISYLLYPFLPHLSILFAVQGYVDIGPVPGPCPGWCT